MAKAFSRWFSSLHSTIVAFFLDIGKKRLLQGSENACSRGPGGPAASRSAGAGEARACGEWARRGGGEGAGCKATHRAEARRRDGDIAPYRHATRGECAGWGGKGAARARGGGNGARQRGTATVRRRCGEGCGEGARGRQRGTATGHGNGAATVRRGVRRGVREGARRARGNGAARGAIARMASR